MSYSFVQVDVFTSCPLGGNPLAVFLDAEGLDSSTMQKIAQEMNLSETTFLFASSEKDVDANVRIFSPTKELPFAGHPTIGTASVLFAEKFKDRQSICLSMTKGLIDVKREGSVIWMQQPQAEFYEREERVDLISESLSLGIGAIDPSMPVQLVSTGFPALLVPIKSLSHIQNIHLNLTALKKLLGTVDMIYLFCLETRSDDCQVHVRSFAPFIGIQEDPATGSVAGALAAYIDRYSILNDNSEFSIEQGMEINRSSVIRARVNKLVNDEIQIQVGGESCRVIEGVLSL